MKDVVFKVYDSSGNFIETWNDASFRGFSKEMNGGLGSCEIELAREITYTGSDLDLNNTVQIDIFDEDVSEPLTIYSGYISDVSRTLKRGKQRIVVQLFGHYTKLSKDILKDGTTTEFDYSGSATEIADILTDFVDYYRGVTDNPEIERTYQSIEDTGRTVEYYFNMMTYREAIDKLTELAPANWYWYLGADNIFNFQARSASTDHKFRLAGEITDLELNRNIEKLRNAVLFYAHQYDGANNLYKLYKDTGSVNQYGRRVRVIRNDEIQAESDAENIALRFIRENKDPNVTLRAVIIDNNESEQGYDIDSIQPGETCEILGLGETLQEDMPERFQIKRVNYTLQKVTIYVEPISATILDRIGKNEQRLDSLERSDNLESGYTT